MYDDEFLKETLSRAFEDPQTYNQPKGIRRFDYDNAHGWWVRVRRDKTPFAKLFSDNKYGGINQSFEEAIRYRHEILSSFPLTIKKNSCKILPMEPEKRVRRRIEKGKRQPYIYWQATWHDHEYKLQRSCFSIKEYGEDGAKSLAIEQATINHNPRPKDYGIHDPYLIHEFTPIPRSDVEIFATINSYPSNGSSKTGKTLVNENPFAFEGERKLELHKSIERDKALRNKKLIEYLTTNEKLSCELCSFNFIANFPFLKKDIIEVHHITPLSKLNQNTVTKLHDLMLLCSNCHFAIHQGDSEENLIYAMEYFENKKNC